jgi:hypothetical protein
MSELRFWQFIGARTNVAKQPSTFHLNLPFSKTQPPRYQEIATRAMPPERLRLANMQRCNSAYFRQNISVFAPDLAEYCQCTLFGDVHLS